jgi:hypothetical protein
MPTDVEDFVPFDITIHVLFGDLSACSASHVVGSVRTGTHGRQQVQLSPQSARTSTSLSERRRNLTKVRLGRNP